MSWADEDRLYHVHYYAPDEEEPASTLTSTGEHPFYVANRRAFVPVKQLVVGDRLCLHDGRPAEVVAIDIEDATDGERFTTYNFEVEGWHTYFVGPEDAGVWVHNRGDGCEQVASMLLNIKKRDPELDDWAAFKRLAERTETPKRRALVDAHLVDAAVASMRSSFKDAAARVDAGASWAQVKHLVPTHKEINQVMGGRRQAALLESHHGATRKWAAQMLKIERPNEFGGFGRASGKNADPRWNAILDEMPAALLDQAFHRGKASRQLIPGTRSLHANLNTAIRDGDTSSTSGIFNALKRGYEDWDNQFAAPGNQFSNEDFGKDLWTVTTAWLESEGVID
jgi:hypothetical protein